MWTEPEEQQVKFFSGFHRHTHSYTYHSYTYASIHTYDIHTHHEMKGKSPQNAKNGCF